MWCMANVDRVPHFLHWDHLGSAHAIDRDVREPEYDVEKFRKATEATDRGYRLAMQVQREVSARRGTGKGMKG